MRYSVVHPIAQFKPQQFDLYAHSEPTDLFPKVGLAGRTVTGRSGVAPIITRLSDNYIASLLPKFKSTAESTTQTETATSSNQPFLTVDMLVDLPPTEPESLYPGIEPVDDPMGDITPNEAVVSSRDVPENVQNDIRRFVERYEGDTGQTVRDRASNINLMETFRKIAASARDSTEAAIKISNGLLGAVSYLVDVKGLLVQQAIRQVASPLGPAVQNYLGNAFMNLRRRSTDFVSPGISAAADSINPITDFNLQDFLVENFGGVVQDAVGAVAAWSLDPLLEQISQSQALNLAGSLLGLGVTIMASFNPGMRGQAARQIEATIRGGNGRYGLRPLPRRNYAGL